MGSNGGDELDPDELLQKTISTMDLDVVGELMAHLSLQDLVREFVKPWDVQLENAIALCRGANECKWRQVEYDLLVLMYGQSIGNYADMS